MLAVIHNRVRDAQSRKDLEQILGPGTRFNCLHVNSRVCSLYRNSHHIVCEICIKKSFG